jgi:uncharacterized protein YhdP
VESVISVNVGLPCDIEWQGKIVRTAMETTCVGQVMARRLNLDGDGQVTTKFHLATPMHKMQAESVVDLVRERRTRYSSAKAVTA